MLHSSPLRIQTWDSIHNIGYLSSSELQSFLSLPTFDYIRGSVKSDVPSYVPLTSRVYEIGHLSLSQCVLLQSAE